MYRKVKIYNAATLFLICAALYFPSKHIEAYFLLIVSVCVLFILVTRVATLNFRFFLALSVIVLFLSGLMISSSRSAGISFRDLSDVMRLIIIATIFLLAGIAKVKSDQLYRIVAFYTTLATAISILQVAGISVVSTVTSVYSSDLHATVSLGVSNRALGMSVGPGQHATIMIFCYCVFLASYFKGDKPSSSPLFFMLLSAVCIILSQSQTGFIVLIGISMYASFYYLIYGSAARKSKAKKFVWAGGGGLSFFIIYFSNELRYLFTLFTLGLNRSSYRAREEKWEFIIDVITNSPSSIIFGSAKTSFGPYGGAMDNEYLFVLGVYGLITFFMVCVVFITHVVFAWVSNTSSNEEHTRLHFLIVSGAVMAWATAFLTDPRVLVLAAILMNSTNISGRTKSLKRGL